MSSRILVVENDPKTQQGIVDLLYNAGHEVCVAADGDGALRLILGERFDVLILARRLPDVSGFDVCTIVRQNGFDGGVVMFNGGTSSADRVRGLRAGADDYLIGPCDPDEFLARVNALLRRLGKTPPEPVVSYRFGSVTIDFENRKVMRNGDPVNLAAKEMQLLRYLIDHRGQVLSREELLANIWSEQPFITLRTVDVHMAWLRQKLEDRPQTPRYLHTIRGSGYRFQPDIGPRHRERPDAKSDSSPPSAGEIASMLDIAVSSSQVPSVLIGRDGRFRFANRAACVLLGYSRRELLDLAVREIDSALFGEGWDRFWGDMGEAGRVVRSGCCRTKRKALVPVEYRCNHFRYGGQEYLMILVHSLTSSQDILQSAAEPERRLQNLISHLPDAFIHFDSRGRLIGSNATVPQLFGKPTAELIGKTLEELAPPNNEAEARRLAEMIRQAIVEQSSNTTVAEWTLPDGSKRRYLVRHIPEKDESDVVVGLLGVARDITE